MSITAAMLPALLGRPVAYQAVFTQLEGVNVQGAIFLSQALFLTQTPTAAKRGGWFWKEQQGVADSWEAETGMSPKQQVTARRQLTTLGVLEEKRQGVPAKTWYRVDVDRLAQVLAEALDDDESPAEPHGFPDSPNGRNCNPPTGESRSAQPERTDSPDRRFLTETTTENNPSLSDASDVFERAAQLDDDGQPVTDNIGNPAAPGDKVGMRPEADRKHPMTLDWEPDPALFAAQCYRAGLSPETPYEPHQLAKFVAHHAGDPARLYAPAGWIGRFVDWIRNDRLKAQSQPKPTGGAHANGRQRTPTRRLTAAEARERDRQQREQPAGGQCFDGEWRSGH